MSRRLPNARCSSVVRAFVVNLALCACSNDPAALYATGPKDAGAAASVSAVPLLPARPDPENVDACEACAKEQCADARASCLEDDACKALLSCKGRASDPARLQACEYEHGFSAWYDDYFGCVFGTRCTAPCRSGENWACAGKYHWPRAEMSRFRERFSFSSPPGVGGSSTSRLDSFVVGAAVRACSGVPCQGAALVDRGTVDATNRVELELNTGVSDSTFEGFLQLDDLGDFDGIHEHQYLAPLWRSGELRVFVPGTRTQVFSSAVFPSLAPGFDFTTAAPLLASVADCDGNGTPAQFDLPDAPEVTPINFSSAAAAYVPGAPPSGAALFTDVLEALRATPLSVRATLVTTGEVVAERQISVETGWITRVALYP